MVCKQADMQDLELQKSKKYATMLYTFDDNADSSSTDQDCGLAVSIDMDEAQTGYSTSAVLNTRLCGCFFFLCVGFFFKTPLVNSHSAHNTSGLDLCSSDPAKLYAREPSLGGSSSLSSSIDCDVALSQRLDALTEADARKWLMDYP